MHELSTVVRLINTACEVAEKEGAVSVRSVTVGLGELSGLLPEYMNKYFYESIGGTVLQDSELILSEIDARAHCDTCGHDFHPEKRYDYLCPDCHGSTCRITAGRGAMLISLEMV